MRSLLLLFLLGLMMVSCGKDAELDNTNGNDPDAPSLIGHWELVEAKRNNRVTETLADLYFTFHEDGRFGTNLGGDAAEGNYAYGGGSEIVTTGVKQALTYQIVEHSEEELVLRSRISNYDFLFSLKRGVEETTTM